MQPSDATGAPQQIVINMHGLRNAALLDEASGAQIGRPAGKATAATSGTAGAAGAGCVPIIVLPIFILGLICFIFWRAGMFDLMFGQTPSQAGVPGSVLQSAAKSVLAPKGDRIFSAPLVLPTADDGPPQIAYITDIDHTYAVVLFDPTTHEQKWRSKSFKDSVKIDDIAGDARHIFVGNDGKLIALNRADGQVAWEVSLASDLQDGYNCQFDACLRVFGANVVALNKDGTVQAFEAGSGKQVWSKRLNYTPDNMFDALGNPALVETADGHNGAATFTVFDTVTGNVLREIAPECSVAGYNKRPFASSDWLPSLDGKLLYVVDQTSAACAYKYDLTTGEQVWAYVPQDNSHGLLPFTKNGRIVISDEGVFVAKSGSDGSVIMLDGKTGEARVLINDARTSFKLVAARAGVLITEATPSYDRKKTQLWGIDVQSGHKLWQVAVKPISPFNTPNVRIVGERVFVGQTLGDEKTLVFDSLDLRTGVSKGAQTVDVGHASVTGISFGATTAWIESWGELYEVDMTTLKVKSMWP